jgi:hypothetical protein
MIGNLHVLVNYLKYFKHAVELCVFVFDNHDPFIDAWPPAGRFVLVLACEAKWQSSIGLGLAIRVSLF